MKIGKEDWPEGAHQKWGKYIPITDKCDKIEVDEWFSVEFDEARIRKSGFAGIRSAINTRWPGGHDAKKRFAMTNGPQDSKFLWVKRVK